MSLQGFYQLGYVTRDLERAIGLMGSGLGLSDFSHFDVEMLLQTREGAKAAVLRVGTAWAGPMQVELIQPLSGHVDAYVAGLPEDPDNPTPRFHHLAVRRESMEEMRRDVAALGLPVVFETDGAGISSIYVDARARIGHYLELVCATAEGWAMMGWPADHAGTQASQANAGMTSFTKTSA